MFGYSILTLGMANDRETLDAEIRAWVHLHGGACGKWSNCSRVPVYVVHLHAGAWCIASGGLVHLHAGGSWCVCRSVGDLVHMHVGNGGFLHALKFDSPG